MKKLFYLIFLLPFVSCTKVIYTHDQVMSRYSTKDQVISEFGLPTYKRSEGKIEEFIYSFGSRLVGQSFSNEGLRTTRINEYERYVKFTFSNNNVTKWASQGVDYKVTKPNSGGTVLLIISIVLLSLGIVILSSGY